MESVEHQKRRVAKSIFVNKVNTFALPSNSLKNVRNKNHLKFFLAAHLVSCAGTWIYRLTFPLLVLHLTGSALNAAILYALEYVPFLVLSLFGGVLADRCSRRRLLIACNLSATLIAGAIGFFIISGATSLILIYVAAMLLACIEPIYHPAFQAILPMVADDDKLEQANSWVHGGENVITLTGPALAGGLIAMFGYSVSVLISAGSFAISTLVIFAVRGTKHRKVSSNNSNDIFREIAIAFTYITRHNNVLLVGSLLFMGTNFSIWLVQANLVYYLTSYHGLTAGQVGIFFGVQGIGALIGASIAPFLIRRISAPLLIIRSTVLGGVSMLFLVVARDPLSAAMVWSLVTIFSSVNVVAWFTLRQRIVPDNLLGRVIATTRMLAFAAIPIASLVSGFAEELLNNMYILFITGGLLRILVGVIAWLSPMGRESKNPRVNLPH